MSDEPITPALTPGEWANREAKRPSGEYPAASDLAEVYLLNDGGFGIFDLMGGASKGSSVSNAGRHAVAALALHDQPFGFTAEDVRLLTEDVESVVAENCRGSEDSPAVAATQAALRHLIARIAALLPPEP